MDIKTKQSVLTKYHIDPDTKKPNSVPVVEKQQVHPLKNLIQMVGEVKKNKKIQIIDRDMIPVNKPEKITQPYHYYVDYEQNLIHFHPDIAGQTIEYKYEDMGVTVISANKIFTKQDEKGTVVELLEDIINMGREAIDVMLTIGGVAIIMKRLEDDIKEGYEVSDKIQADIQQAKDEILNVRGNKEVIIKSSDWTLNSWVSGGYTYKTYEKEITHDLNSENLHVTAKNSDTKEAVTIGYKILDKTRILLKSDEAINMSVILSASYYHATQTISDDIAEEVVKARKGEASLDVKITKIDEQLDNTTNNLQNQIDELVLASGGDSNLEVVQSRNDLFGNSHNILNSRLNNIENLLSDNKSKMAFGTWLNGAVLATGAINPTNLYIYTQNIYNVEVGTELYFSIISGYKYAIAWYNSDETFVSRSDFKTSALTIRATRPKFRIVIGYDDVNDILPSDYGKLSAYKQINIKLNEMENIYNPTIIKDWESGALTSSTGDELENVGFIRTKYFHSLPVGTKLKIVTQEGYKARVHFYNVDKTQVSVTDYLTSNTITVNSPYFKIILTTNETTTEVYVSIASKLNVSIEGIESNNNVLNNKTVYSFGDSLLAGHYSGKGMIDGLVTSQGMSYTKYAVNGSTVIGSTSGSILYQINNASSTVPDFIVFDGLTNDAYQTTIDSKLGLLSDNYDGNYNTETFYGAFEHICYNLRTKYMDSNIIYVVPHKMPTRDKSAQEKLTSIALEVCKKWSIAVVDIYNKGQINCYLDNMRTKYSYNNQGETIGGNGTHLTGEGYDKWYAPLIKSKMIELLNK